jgi:glutathione synthase/RimK-type ligase-like ATP-grasp enzyme
VILIFSHDEDEHLEPVLEALARRGAAAVVLDLADLPRFGTVVFPFGQPGARELRLDGRPPLDLDRVTAVWWRRPRTPVPPLGMTPAHAAFAVRQTGEAVTGLVTALAGQARFVNDPWRDDAAAHKTFQLALAGPAGLTVPATLVTSDPGEAGRFLEALGEGGAIHKPIQAQDASEWRVTRRVRPRDVARLEALRLAPVILQEHVPGVDVRVTVVGDELFAAEFDARATRSPDDFRVVTEDPACAVRACALPAPQAQALRRLMDRLGLVYGAADFRRRDDGRWFFLEVNPAGQWRFVERRTGQPITEALASVLARA